MRTQLFTLLLLLFSMSVSCQPKVETYTIETTLGKIKIKLYDKTPFHKANFEKLVESKFYDNVMFHRIIPGFMIQTGNDGTKNSKAGEPSMGEGSINYTVPAEFVPEYFHKKGALAAARTGDQVNPEKRSSGSQFYIVQGKKYTDLELDNIQRQAGIKLTDAQRNIYKTIGGTPFLDQNYTVFGEVVEGLDVVDKIAAVQTVQPGDWPKTDIRIIRVVKN